MRHRSGHQSSPVSEEEMEKLRKDYEGFRSWKLITLSPGGWRLPQSFLQFADKIYDFKFRGNDVIVMTWPKCGTTWIQEIVWTMKHNPNLDQDASGSIMARSPFLEADMMRAITSDHSMKKDWSTDAFNKYCQGKDPADGVHIQLAECIPDPRVIKTHLPLSLLNPSLLDTAKVVYMARNPKDVIVSQHHHQRIRIHTGFVGSFEDFVRYFIQGYVLYAPYWLHLKEAWESRNHPNLHFMFYEDMKEDPLREIKKLDAFLGTNLTQAQLERIVNHTSFKEMKTRGEAAQEDATAVKLKSDLVKKEGGIFRKGISGDWKEKFTTEVDDLINQWIYKNFHSFQIPFKYEV